MPLLSDGSAANSRSCRRFVFLGHVRKNKGVDLLIQVGKRLEKNVSLDVFGPLGFDVTQKEVSGMERLRYCGTLQQSDVVPTLRQYDALLLPTYYPGEGYPGVILEAYAAGLPVISTRWQAIPEIVDDTTGLLVEPQDVDALFNAMQSLAEDRELYKRLCDGVKKKRMEFSSEASTLQFVKLCEEAVKSRTI